MTLYRLKSLNDLLKMIKLRFPTELHRLPDESIEPLLLNNGLTNFITAPKHQNTCELSQVEVYEDSIKTVKSIL